MVHVSRSVLGIPPPPPVTASNPRARFALASAPAAALNGAAGTHIPPPPPPPPPLPRTWTGARSPPSTSPGKTSKPRSAMVAGCDNGDVHSTGTFSSAPGAAPLVPPPPLTTTLLKAQLSPPHECDAGSPAEKENSCCASPSPIARGTATKAWHPSVLAVSPLNVAAKPASPQSGAECGLTTRSPSRDAATKHAHHTHAKCMGKFLYIKSFRVKPQTPTSEEKRLRGLMRPAHRRGLCVSPNVLRQQLQVRSAFHCRSPQASRSPPSKSVSPSDSAPVAERDVSGSSTPRCAPIQAAAGTGDDSVDSAARSLIGDITAASLSPTHERLQDGGRAEGAAAAAAPLATRRTLLDILGEAMNADGDYSSGADAARQHQKTRCSEEEDGNGNGDGDDDDPCNNDSVLEVEITDDAFDVVLPSSDSEHDPDTATAPPSPSATSPRREMRSVGALPAAPKAPTPPRAPNSPPQSEAQLGPPMPMNYRRAAYLAHGIVTAPHTSQMTVPSVPASSCHQRFSADSGYDSGEEELRAAIARRASKFFAAHARFAKHYIDEYDAILAQAMTTPFARLEPMTPWEDSRKLVWGRRCMLLEVLDCRAREHQHQHQHRLVQHSMHSWLFAFFLPARVDAFEEHLRLHMELREQADRSQLLELMQFSGSVLH